MFCNIDEYKNAQNYIGLVVTTIQIAKTTRSTSIRYRYDAEVSDRCLIDGDSVVLAIWALTLTIDHDHSLTSQNNGFQFPLFTSVKAGQIF